MTKQSRPILFLPVESTPRELDYKLNIARHFCHAGFDVMIGNPPFIRDELKYKNYKGIFLEKGVNPTPEYYKSLSDKGIFLFDLGDEGAANPVYSLSYHKCVDSLKRMRKIFLWGDAQRKDLNLLFDDRELTEKYTVIGNPGFDLCLTKFKKYNQKLNPLKWKDYILVNTNFGLVNSYTIDEHIEACNEISPATLDLFKVGYDLEIKQWAYFKVALRVIMESFPGLKFVIRPHPSEKIDFYEREFGHFDNVRITKDGNVNYVISGAKLVLHKDCTTALQSYLMEIPSISLGEESLRSDYAPWTQTFSLTPNGIKETVDILSTIMTTGEGNKETAESISRRAQITLNEWFAGGKECSGDLVSTILNDIGGAFDGMAPYKLKDTRPWLARFKLAIRRYLPLHYKIAKAARETLIEYTKRDIEKRLGLFEEVDPLGINYNVKKIYPNTYWIRKK